MQEAPSAAPLAPRHAGAWFLASAALSAALVWRLGPSSWHVVAATTAGVLVWLSAVDLQYRLLPDKIVLPVTACLLAAATAWADAPLTHWLAAALAGLALGLAVRMQPQSLGMGDAKLALLLGALLGGGVLNALAIGFLLLAIVALAMIARDGRAGLSRHLPLGPFLAAGALAVLLF